MASVNGLSLKNVREMTGEEGLYYTANVYLGNKKVATWAQDPRGGIVDSLFMKPGYSKEKLLGMIKRAMPVTPTDLGDPLDPESGFVAELFFPALVSLKDSEREYRRFSKKGYRVMVMCTDGMHYHYAFFTDPAVGRMTVGEFSKRYPEEHASLVRNMFRNSGLPVFHAYSSEGDFEIGNPEDIKELAC